MASGILKSSKKPLKICPFSSTFWLYPYGANARPNNLNQVVIPIEIHVGHALRNTVFTSGIIGQF